MTNDPSREDIAERLVRVPLVTRTASNGCGKKGEMVADTPHIKHDVTKAMTLASLMRLFAPQRRSGSVCVVCVRKARTPAKGVIVLMDGGSSQPPSRWEGDLHRSVGKMWRD
ncbi:MAG TPA: hypothetical protein VFB12_30770 [Ktedonobacteraceae bacterium]|nr:hypothetical protein [Ktedonobacteraceae bacterium]